MFGGARLNIGRQNPQSAHIGHILRVIAFGYDADIDPFFGSGTTGVIAHALNRRFIGTEYSAANAKSAFERLESGPVRLGAATGQSTAIFRPRKARDTTRARFTHSA